MDKTVSFDNEKLILVDTEDKILGYESKAACHRGDGILHRAFSIFIFDSSNRLLLQKRSAEKLLWPLFWSNSCCSHPREGESYEIATMRRLEEELGLQASLSYLYKFQYQARFGSVGSEHELCSVYAGRSDSAPSVNQKEIAEWKYIEGDELSRELVSNPAGYTPWFKMEWEHISRNYMEQIRSLKP